MSEMNSKTIAVISVIALIIIAVITNPKKQLHAEQVSQKIYQSENVMMKLANETLTMQIIDYNNYIVFSIGNYNKIKSLGLFGNVFVLADDNEIQKHMNTQNNQSTSKKAEKKKLSKEQQSKIDELIGN